MKVNTFKLLKGISPDSSTVEPQLKTAWIFNILFQNFSRNSFNIDPEKKTTYVKRPFHICPDDGLLTGVPLYNTCIMPIHKDVFLHLLHVSTDVKYMCILRPWCICVHLHIVRFSCWLFSYQWLSSLLMWLSPPVWISESDTPKNPHCHYFATV